MRCIAVLSASILLLPALGWGQTQAEQDLVRTKHARAAAMATHQPSALLEAASSHDRPYQVNIGIYALYEPIIDPAVTWVRLACFSTPGVSYPGSFGLVYVDVVITHEDGQWLSGGFRDGEGNDRGICDVNQGIDTTFIEIPRSLQVTSWFPTITNTERTENDVALGSITIYPVHLYE